MISSDSPRNPSAPERMRVAHVITNMEIGGAEISLVRLVEALAPAGIETVVISLSSGGRLGPGLLEKGIPFVELGMNGGGSTIAGIFRLWTTLRSFRPHVVQTWLYHADFAGLVAGRLARAPAIVWNLRCSELDLERERASLRFLLRVLVRTSHSPAAIVCNSAAGRRAHERLGYRARRWELIPNGFDTSVFSPSAEAKVDVRTELGIPQETPLVGLVARLHPLKDHATFLRTAALVAARRADVQFIVAGRRVADSLDLRDAAARVGDGCRVHVIGETSNVARLLAALDVAVSSSTSEGFPNVVAEAMACGTPCAVTDVGDSAIVVGDTGLVVPPRDAAALADAVLRLLELPVDERQALGLRARARIMRHYSLTDVAARYRSLYEELIQPNDAATAALVSDARVGS
jgi:glycosyltransferase involved in cell wall biosynthesis